jgi:hypothetical protein
VLVSDQISASGNPPVPGSERGVVVARTVVFPIDVAAHRYISDHGVAAFHHAVEGMLNELFPSATP